ncbi:unnamed protein product, partial [Adineta steineri]
DKGNLGSKVFFVWGSTCVGCLLFAFFCIWETKGLSLEQVDYLVSNSSPLTSAKLNKALRAGTVVATGSTSGGPAPFSNKIQNAEDAKIANPSTDKKATVGDGV